MARDDDKAFSVSIDARETPKGAHIGVYVQTRPAERLNEPSFVVLGAGGQDALLTPQEARTLATALAEAANLLQES